MKFCDKLNYIMNITQTSNKELAKSIYVDPSLVSVLRTGKRGQPQNKSHIKNMAQFFSKKCTANFQRNALAEIMEIPSIRSSMPQEVLSKHIENWLIKDSELMENIVSEIDVLPHKIENSSQKSDTKDLKDASFYFGEEGRKTVMDLMTANLLKAEKPASILVVSEDNLEWLLSNYLLSQEIQSRILALIERGFTFCQILPAINFLPRYTESLKFWLPMYATGKVKVYYYPRLRDNLYRRSMIVVPGNCVRISNAIGLGSSSDITMFSTDFRVVEAHIMQFNEILSLCRPALNVFSDYKQIVPSFVNYCSCKGVHISLSSFLLPVTMPKDLVKDILQKENLAPRYKAMLSFFLKKSEIFLETMKKQEFFDIVRLPKPEEIRSGKIPAGTPYILFSEQPLYTVQMYVRHLKNILYLMEEYENYIFIPCEDNFWDNYSITANSDGTALLYRNSEPSLLLEMHRPEMVTAAYEYLMQKAEKLGFEGINRTKNRMIVEELIRELGGGSSQKQKSQGVK